MMLKMMMALGCILVFSVCNAGSILNGLENVGRIPKLDRTDTIAGIDNDKNGIRDDIDAYILKHYPKEEQRKAVNQFAKSFQAYLVTDTKDNIVVKEVSNENTRAMTCVFSKFNNSDIGPNGSVIKEIINLTTNTKMRLLAYHEFNDALDGTVISIPKKDYCNE